MTRIPFPDLTERTETILRVLGVPAERAALSARLIAETDRDGVRTHGIARLPRLAEMIALGRIAPAAEPERTAAFGAMERWTGHRGLGNLAAHAATARAMELAREHGVGVVALADTTHWLRGGAFGWQAAEAGCALLCWTNTMPNLPPWGATSAALGNNPLVVAAPRAAGPVVLDIAMSQFSYGMLASYRQRGELLPYAGGFDAAGELTRDPKAIEDSRRPLPIGLWKGSGLAFVLDLLAAMLSGGRASHELPPDPLAEVGQSQVFLAVSPASVSGTAEMERIAEGCIAGLHAAEPVLAGARPRYPGEGTLRTRADSLHHGVVIEEPAWSAFLALESSLQG